MRTRPSATGSSLLFRLSIVSAVGLIGCGPAPGAGDDGIGDDDSSSEPDARSYPPDARPWNNDGGGQTKGCHKIHLLFVIDNSGSMRQEQTNVDSRTSRRSSTVLEASGLDYRVAVTTTGARLPYSMTTPIPGIPPIPSTTGGENGAMLNPAGQR